jgi:hypothetical protein
VVVDQLAVGSVGNQASLLAESRVLLAVELGEAPLLGDDDLLLSGELEGSAAGGLDTLIRKNAISFLYEKSTKNMQ